MNAENLGGAFSAERLAYAGQMTLLGLITVFSVLALLWGVLSIFKVFAYNIPERRKKKAALSNAPADVIDEGITAVAESTDDRADIGQTVAVITAAVAAYLTAENGGTEVPDGSFRVVSFRRVTGRSSWNTGR